MQGCIYVHTAYDSYIDDFSQGVFLPAITIKQYTATIVEMLNASLHDGGKMVFVDTKNDMATVMIHTREIHSIEIEEDPVDGQEPEAHKICYDAFGDEFWCMQISHVVVPAPPLREDDCNGDGS